MCVLFLVNGFVGATWAARLPAVQEDTGASLQAVGLIMFAAAVGSIFGLGIGPLLLNRFGARISLAVTFVLFLAGMLFAALSSTLAGSLPLIAIGLFIWGFHVGAADVVVNMEAATVEQRSGKTLMPLMHAFFSFGTVIGALTGSAAAVAHWTVSTNLGVVIVLGALLLAWALPGIPLRHELSHDGSNQRMSSAERMRHNLRAWGSLSVLLIGVGVLANGVAEGAANDWLAIGAVTGHGQSQATGAFLFAMFVSGMTLMRLVGGPLVDRWGRVVILRCSALAALLGVALFIWGSGFWVLVLATVLWGIGVALGFPLGMSAAADHPQGAARVSVVSTLGYGAFLIGPPGLGFLGQRFGILEALIVLLALLVVAILVAGASRERSGPHAKNGRASKPGDPSHPLADEPTLPL